MLLLAGVLACAGCQAAAGPEVLGGAAKLAAGDSAAHLDGASAQSNVSEADAVRGMLLLLGEGQETTFADAVASLRQRKIACPTWSLKADRPLTKGRLAYMVYQACGIRGGLTLSLWGPSQRYCLKELQYLGLMTAGMPYTGVTGMEYVAVLTRADEMRQTGRLSRAMSPEGGE